MKRFAVIFTLAVTLISPFVSCAQSYERKQDTVIHNNETVIVIGKTEPVKNKIKSHSYSRNQIHNKISQTPDSTTGSSTRTIQSIDSIKSSYALEYDSLQESGMPQEKYTDALDSIKQRAPLQEYKKVQEKRSQTEVKVEQTLQNPTNKANEKLNQFSNEAGGQGNLPSNVDFPNLKKPNSANNLPNQPKIASPSLPAINNPLKQSLVNIKNKYGAILKPSSFKNLEKLGQIKGLYKIRKGSAVNSTLKGHAVDKLNLRYGNVDQAMESKLGVKLPNSTVNSFEQQTQAVTELQTQTQSLPSKEDFKKQTLAKAKEITMQQLALQKGKLQETVGKVSKYQQRGHTILAKVKGLPKKEPEQKQLASIERFVPGFTFQVQKSNLVLVDLTPSLKYKINHIFSVGAGWNERLAIDEEGRYKSAYKIYGIRSFSEVSILKGISFRMDVERINAFVPLSKQQIDIGQRKWVWIYMAGAKKEFSFAHGVLGNVQFMYNLYDPQNNNPYTKRFNVRFGFEFPLKEKNQIKLRN